MNRKDRKEVGQSLNKSLLVNDIRQMIEETRSAVATAVNAGLTALYWHIGKRILEEILRGERAEYGQEIVISLGRELTAEFGRGFEEKNLRRMIQFAEAFPDEEIVAALRRQLSWTHFKILIPIEDSLKREFYAEICRIERWSTRTLQERIDSMLYERTAISRKPEEVIRHELSALRGQDQLTPELVFRDPYVLDFLGLKDRYLEKDLEDAILRELESFLLELGAGFAFVARQQHIQIDNDDFYIDLLFYHRSLHRLIAIDLKLGNFKAEYKGQMELYLRWLDKYERQQGEEAPLGIILCAGKKQEQIELLELNRSGIHVAEYLTELPSRELLAERLHRAIKTARARLEAQ
ncbi:PDDEXK nuclease domain-containing protein [Methanosarcina vacuolata]|uniref:Putative cytoplasmic protein n=1 Tax=Methanosarcina vacuolata Z-761 TaxID=1434123 RepID=A0A0E3Q5P8_9EURY|nr:PDDEXK nuclease domain-containing protein [Methanosarcina vacuolata]AKB44814.1 Putative cytoplasmic protein [Methanosarcina vacuolata Z-761]